MTVPTIYRSADASAPALSGTAGDLVNLLDKCLVSGYGSQSAAGWARQTGFAGNSSTRAVFRAPAGTRFYLDIDDRGASGVLTGASGKEAAVRAYESMTDVSTGTNPWPTIVQSAAAQANWRKSATADAVPRGWFLIADDRTFILGILNQDANSAYHIYYFGDFYSLKSGDAYRALITDRPVVNGPGFSGTLGSNFSSSDASGLTGIYVPRRGDGTGTSLNETITTLPSSISINTQDDFTTSYDGGLYFSRVFVFDAGVITPNFRGWLRGVYNILNWSGLNDGDTFSGVGEYAGRSFIVVSRVTNNGTAAFALETTTWDTSS